MLEPKFRKKIGAQSDNYAQPKFRLTGSELITSASKSNQEPIIRNAYSEYLSNIDLYRQLGGDIYHLPTQKRKGSLLEKYRPI